MDKHQLVNLMVGRDMSTLFPPRDAKIGETVLEVKDLNRGSKYRMFRLLSEQERYLESAAWWGPEEQKLCV